jgi:hypothetical protein
LYQVHSEYIEKEEIDVFPQDMREQFSSPLRTEEKNIFDRDHWKDYQTDERVWGDLQEVKVLFYEEEKKKSSSSSSSSMAEDEMGRGKFSGGRCYLDKCFRNRRSRRFFEAAGVVVWSIAAGRTWFEAAGFSSFNDSLFSGERGRRVGDTE